MSNGGWGKNKSIHRLRIEIDRCLQHPSWLHAICSHQLDSSLSNPSHPLISSQCYPPLSHQLIEDAFPTFHLYLRALRPTLSIPCHLLRKKMDRLWRPSSRIGCGHSMCDRRLLPACLLFEVSCFSLLKYHSRLAFLTSTSLDIFSFYWFDRLVSLRLLSRWSSETRKLSSFANCHE